ncbi:MAG: tripartite tricarboxylate transporter substrate binding protein, partial [Burkholderiales bacterium]|nr:tripartite tricarboxylate transporter substrate binding protein [Burkholderiales bacterium]
MQFPSARRLCLALCAGLLCATALQSAHAQPFPSRAIRFIVPIGAGSGSDTITRLAAKLVAAQLGQPAFVENRPGGDTIIAVQTLLNSPADGYSILMISPSSVVINPVVTEKLPYDAQRDIRPLTGALRSAAVLVTGSGSAFKNFGDVIAAARKSPKSVSMASYGQHYRLGGLMMQQMAGVEFNAVTYKSPAQVQTDLIGGTVDLALLDIGGALPLITAGKLRALAVTGRDRHPQLAAVPTVRESGLPNYDLYVWIGFGINAKTPEPVAQKLEAALLEAMNQPEFRTYVTQTAGADLFTVSGKDLTALI